MKGTLTAGQIYAKWPHTDNKKGNNNNYVQTDPLASHVFETSVSLILS